jgi:V/A-type H+-transporting ATPase subunit E
MALEDIFRALEQEAQAKCAEIRMGANAEASSIDEESTRRCKELVQERLERAAGPIEARARRIVTDARFEARRAVAVEREAQVDAAYAAAGSALAELRTKPGYVEKFGVLLDEALASARVPSSVLVDAADEKIATDAIAARKLDVPVRATLDTAGGVLVLSDEDRVRHDNTFEARLERVADMSRTHVGELLFG